MNESSLLALRPLSIGELFDRTFRLFRKHFFVFSLLPPVVVLENLGIIDSLKRAWELGKLRFWWV